MSYQEQQGGGSESVVVNGAVEGVEVKPNGRFVVKVREIGSTSQYALNLNTKEQSIAQQMMGAVGQQFSFVCGLSRWTNNNGQPVTSKWINGVAPLQGGMQAQPQQQWSGANPGTAQQAVAAGQAQWAPQPQPQFVPQQQAPQPQRSEPPSDDAFIRRVSFLAALEPAVAMLAYLPKEQHGVPALVKMADFFARTAILRGQQGFGQQNGNPGPEYGDPGPQPGDPGADYDDDSVPF